MKVKYFKGKVIQRNECSEGEDMTTKITRLVTTKEPITDGAPLIFTEKKDGVLPAYDIRTDRFELAQKAMDKATAQQIAKAGASLEIPVEETEKKPAEQTTTA